MAILCYSHTKKREYSLKIMHYLGTSINKSNGIDESSGTTYTNIHK